jgi:hypothetical protein
MSLLSRVIICLVFCVGALAGMSVAQQNTLVYVSFITGTSSGGTNIYQVSSSGAELIGTANTGGGGPVAVDSQQNFYTVEADLENGYQVNSPVYMYPSGGTKGKLIFTASNFGASAMTVGPDGTVYLAGEDYPNTTDYSVMKFAPPDYVGQLLPADPQSPGIASGISLDAAGDLFVGWFADNTGVFSACSTGCIEELPVESQTWQTRLPDLAANDISAGPFVTSNGALIFWTAIGGAFNYFETVPAKQSYPSQVIQEPVNLFPNGGNPLLAFEAGGSELWATVSGLKGTDVLGIAYPAGNVSTRFTVNAPKNLLYITGIAVSPAYEP